MQFAFLKCVIIFCSWIITHQKSSVDVYQINCSRPIQHAVWHPPIPWLWTKISASYPITGVEALNIVDPAYLIILTQSFLSKDWSRSSSISSSWSDNHSLPDITPPCYRPRIHLQIRGLVITRSAPANLALHIWTTRHKHNTSHIVKGYKWRIPRKPKHIICIIMIVPHWRTMQYMIIDGRSYSFAFVYP